MSGNEFSIGPYKMIRVAHNQMSFYGCLKENKDFYYNNNNNNTVFCH